MYRYKYIYVYVIYIYMYMNTHTYVYIYMYVFPLRLRLCLFLLFYLLRSTLRLKAEQTLFLEHRLNLAKFRANMEKERKLEKGQLEETKKQLQIVQNYLAKRKAETESMDLRWHKDQLLILENVQKLTRTCHQ